MFLRAFEQGYLNFVKNLPVSHIDNFHIFCLAKTSLIEYAQCQGSFLWQSQATGLHTCDFIVLKCIRTRFRKEPISKRLS